MVNVWLVVPFVVCDIGWDIGWVIGWVIGECRLRRLD
jgi:hypothetical protein